MYAFFTADSQRSSSVCLVHPNTTQAIIVKKNVVAFAIANSNQIP